MILAANERVGSMNEQEGSSSTNGVPIKPGQLLTAAFLGRQAVVRILGPWSRKPGEWLCQEVATGYFLVVAESEIGDHRQAARLQTANYS